jgi:hypothetical protein
LCNTIHKELTILRSSPQAQALLGELEPDHSARVAFIWRRRALE